MRRGLLPGAALAACAALAPVPAPAQDCRIALSLAIDVSSSVDAADYALQAGGLIAALTAPEVVDAFLAVPGSSVALHVYEWSGRWQQVVMLDWLIVSTRDDLVEAAARLAALPRSHDDFPTALGAGIGFGAQRLAEAPACRRKVLDVSGDGINNEAFGPASARRAFPFEGVTVNGLVIGAEREALAIPLPRRGDPGVRRLRRGGGGFRRLRAGHAPQAGARVAPAGTERDGRALSGARSACRIEDRVEFGHAADGFPGAAKAALDGEGVTGAELDGAVRAGEADATLEDHAELVLGVVDGKDARLGLPVADMEAAGGVGEGVPEPGGARAGLHPLGAGIGGLARPVAAHRAHMLHRHRGTPFRLRVGRTILEVPRERLW